jgi:hypothetical protein
VRSALRRFELKLDRLGQQFTNRALLRRALEDAAQFDQVAPTILEYRDVLERHRATDGLIQYSAVIVLLYGAFEQFIEDSIIAFVRGLNRMIPTFQQLPERIKSQHTNLSAALLQARATRKYESRVQEVEVLQNLLTCAQGGEGYRLNAMAFAQHSANIRIALLSEMFSQIDLAGITTILRQDPVFFEIAARRSGVEIANQPDSVVFRDLDDLAERRNDVAHGEVATILSDTELAAMLDFIRHFSVAFVAGVDHDMLHREIKFRGTLLPPPIAVYDNKIACFTDSPIDLCKGGRLAVIGGNGRAMSGAIHDLQINKEPHELIRANGGEAFGVSVDFHVKQHWSFYALPDPPA